MRGQVARSTPAAHVRLRRPAPARRGELRGERAAARRSGGLPASRNGNVSPRAAASLFAEAWDAAPRNWRSFWATKLAAAVVESNAAQETVTVRPVEASGLDAPPTWEEAQKRLRTNAVLYRQNYLVGALACLFAGALRRPNLLAALAAAAVAAAVSSDRLLGEAALALDGQLVWNAKRVAGVDRALLRSAAPVACVLCLALTPLASAGWLVSSLLMALLLALVHAVLRPVDLGAVVDSFWGDLTTAKSRDEVGRSFVTAAKGLSGLWAQRKSSPAAPVPIIIVERGGQEPPPQQQPPPPPPLPRLPGR